MKKLLIFITLALLTMCFFTVVISAEEKTVSSASELEAAISDFNTSGGSLTLNIAGDLTGLSGDVNVSKEGTIVFNLTSDATVDKKIYFSGKTNITFALNGYTFQTVGVTGGGELGTAILVNNAGAVFKMSNGTFKSSDVGVWTRCGDFTIESVVFLTREESVYSAARVDYQKVVIKDSTLCGVDLTDAAEGVLIEDCVITACTDGIWYGVSMDCWIANDGQEHPFIVRNTKTSDGRTLSFSIVGGFQPVYIYDSDYLPGGEFGTDSGGCAYLEKITSSTCLTQGKKLIYNGTSTKVASLVSEEDLPLAPHAIDSFTGVEWENFFENGFNTGLCEVCKAQAREQEASASPLFENKGVSHAEYQDTTKSMTQGFKVNTEMLVYLAEGYDFGIIATANKDGGEIAPTLDGTGVVSASFLKAGFSIFNVKVTNIPEANKDTKIVFCAYLVNGDKTYYLNNGTTAEAVVGLDYTTVSSK